MKNKKQNWIKTSSGWQIKTSFSEDISMTELATPSFEEREPHGVSTHSGEEKENHEEWIHSLLAELRQIADRANEITKTLEDNGINHERIVSFIMNKQ